MIADWTRRLWLEHAELLWWFSATSLWMLVGSVLLVPWLVLRAPHDVFVRESPSSARSRAYLYARWLLRNTLGVMLLFAGILMLVLPGQGLLTIVAALCLMEIPCKRELLKRVVARPRVWKALEWIRARAGKAPFDPP